MEDIDDHYQHQIDEIQKQKEQEIEQSQKEIQSLRQKVRTSSQRNEELQHLIAELNGAVPKEDDPRESSVDSMDTLGNSATGSGREDGGENAMTTPIRDMPAHSLRDVPSAITEESSTLTQESPPTVLDHGRQRRESREIDESVNASSSSSHSSTSVNSPLAPRIRAPPKARESVEIGATAADFGIPQIPQDQVDEMVRQQVEQQVSALKNEMEMNLALKEDSITAKHKKKYEEMERVLLGKIDGLEGEKTEWRERQDEMEIEKGRLQSTTHELQSEIDGIRQQLEDKEGRIAAMRSDLDAAERSRIKLLETFMSEMDRMRDEIKKLNAITMRRPQ